MSLAAKSTGESIEALRGAKAIAEFLYGDEGGAKKVYHLAEKGELPVFRLGSVICARKSAIMAWIEEQESGGPKRGPAASLVRRRQADRRR